MNGRTNSNNSTDGSMDVPLSQVSDVTVNEGNGKVLLKWTDPKDKYATDLGDTSDTEDQLVSKWDKTIVTRKTDAYPATPSDGTVATVSSVHNQYQSTSFSDEGLTNGTSYHYSIFSVNTNNVPSSPYIFIATPTAGVALKDLTEGTVINMLENGSPVQFYVAKHNYEPDLNGAGRTCILRMDPFAVSEFGDYPGSPPWGYTDTNGNSVHWLLIDYSPAPGYPIDENGNGPKAYTNRFGSKIANLIGQTSFRSMRYNYGIQTDKASSFVLSATEYGYSGRIYNHTIPVEGTPFPAAGTIIPFTPYSGNKQIWTRSPYECPNPLSIIYNPSMSTDNTHINMYDGYILLAGGPSCGVRPAFTLPENAFVDSDTMTVTGDTI